jgi:acetyl esterase/lipase
MAFSAKKLTSILITATLLLYGCSKKETIAPDPFDPAVEKQLKNEAYGSNALQKADVYLPANRGTSTRTMVLIHGGFWTSGDKTDMDTLLGAIKAADATINIVNINYRLADGTSANYHPAQMEDIGLLLNYILANAAKWHIGNSIALTGVSSGAHLALLYTYAYDTEKKVKAVASVIGPTNFTDPYYNTNPLFQDIALKLFGKTYQQDSALYKSASPLYRVTTTSPPTFWAYGGNDILIPTSNANALNDKLTALNITHEFWFYPTESHDLSRTAILDIIKNMAAFYKKQL